MSELFLLLLLIMQAFSNKINQFALLFLLSRTVFWKPNGLLSSSVSHTSNKHKSSQVFAATFLKTKKLNSISIFNFKVKDIEIVFCIICRQHIKPKYINKRAIAELKLIYVYQFFQQNSCIITNSDILF